MSYSNEWYGNIRLNHDGTWLTISPHYVKISKGTTDEPWSAEIKWVNNDEIGNTINPSTIYIARTVEIYGDTISSPTNLLFRGRVGNIGQRYDGENKFRPEKYISINGMGKRLVENPRDLALHADTQKNQLLILAEEARTLGFISTYDIITTVPDVNCKKRDGKQSYWDMFSDIVKDVDFEFHVDDGGTLKAYPRGYYTFNGFIVPDYEANIEWNGDNIINTFDVWGAATIVIGSDAEYTEGTANWSGPGLSRDSVWKQEGSYSIKSTTGVSEAPYLERTFSPALNLERGGEIHFRALVLADVAADVNGVQLEFNAYCGTDKAEYFTSTLALPGGKNYTGADGWQRYLAEVDAIVGFNNMDNASWVITGKPDWSSIDVLRIGVAAPIGLNTSEFNLDELQFQSNYVVGSYGSIDPVVGSRRAPPVKDQNVTQEQAQILAEHIVNLYKDPRLIITDARVEDISGLTVGMHCTISLFGSTIETEIKNLDIEFDGKKYEANISLAEGSLNEPEKIIKDSMLLLEKMAFNTDTWKRIISTSAFIDTATGMLDWNRVVDEFGYKLWTNNKYKTVVADGNSEFYEFEKGDTSSGSVTLYAGGAFDILFGGSGVAGYFQSKDENMWLDVPPVTGQMDITLPSNSKDFFVGMASTNGSKKARVGIRHESYDSGNLYFFAGTVNTGGDYMGASISLGAFDTDSRMVIEWQHTANGLSTIEVYKNFLAVGTFTTALLGGMQLRPFAAYAYSSDTTISINSYKWTKPLGSA